MGEGGLGGWAEGIDSAEDATLEDALNDPISATHGEFPTEDTLGASPERPPSTTVPIPRDHTDDPPSLPDDLPQEMAPESFIGDDPEDEPQEDKTETGDCTVEFQGMTLKIPCLPEEEPITEEPAEELRHDSVLIDARYLNQ
jgi:hypothetical protein